MDACGIRISRISARQPISGLESVNYATVALRSIQRVSIERTAPERFDFQDLVCIELALRFEQSIGVSILIEQGSGEDALLKLDEPNAPRRFEVQAKDEASPVAVTVSGCLARDSLWYAGCFACFSNGGMVKGQPVSAYYW